MAFYSGIGRFSDGRVHAPSFKDAGDPASRHGTFDPGYCPYTVGKLRMRKLREDYRKQQAVQGEQFNMRAFYNEGLGHGQPPVRLLREYLLRDPAMWEATLGR